MNSSNISEATAVYQVSTAEAVGPIPSIVDNATPEVASSVDWFATKTLLEAEASPSQRSKKNFFLPGGSKNNAHNNVNRVEGTSKSVDWNGIKSDELRNLAPETNHNRQKSSVEELNNDPFEPYLSKLEDIHWEKSSESVALVVGEMLGTVTKMNEHVDEHLDVKHLPTDGDTTMQDALRREIHHELSEINGLMQDFVDRHPSIVHNVDEDIFQQLRELGYDIGSVEQHLDDSASHSSGDEH